MSLSNSNFSETDLVEGLASAHPPALQHIFTQIRNDVIRSVQSMGGSLADGNVFFQTAIIDTARLARSGHWPTEVSMKMVLVKLATQHYATWSTRHLEKTEQSATESPATTLADEAPKTDATPENTTKIPDWLPSNTELEQSRKHIYVWKTMGKLSSGCRDALMQQRLDDETTCKTELAMALNTSKSNTEILLPSYAAEALLRKEDFHIWTTIRQYEDYAERGMSIEGKGPKSSSNTAKYLFFALLAVTLGYSAYTYFNQPKDATEVFNKNFEPPQSLLADMNRRFENDTSGIVRPERCNELLAEADAFYAKKNYSAAQDPLFLMLDNDELSNCRSDAFFALGIISLKQEDPAEAIQYLSKIENIEAYGEDLYWYQALAFVQMAKISNSYREVAIKAMGRFLENTRNEARKQQGEQMIQELK